MTFVWEALQLQKMTSFLHFQMAKVVVKKIEAGSLANQLVTIKGEGAPDL